MEHLNDEQLKSLKQTLQAQRQQLRSELRDELLRNDREQYGELAGQVHDAGDESVADLLSDVNVAAVGRSIRELREVEAALQRIDMGSYGLCEDCQEVIAYERLRAYPAARRCLADQERHEKLYAEEPTPKL